MESPTATLADSLPLADRKAIDAACDRFEAACREGERPDLDDFLRGARGPAREVLFRELLALELEYRLGDPEPPRRRRLSTRGSPSMRRAIDIAFAATGPTPARPRPRPRSTPANLAADSR